MGLRRRTITEMNGSTRKWRRHVEHLYSRLPGKKRIHPLRCTLEPGLPHAGHLLPPYRTHHISCLLLPRETTAWLEVLHTAP
ncbi:hypothetical protein Sfum_2730 [Syntrophobacter fumaroxidans MPOB]|uniref:Uncharacterized protein n=1 Tax=Syntrophobacter fumaroxidans (strain DSM 10017 / MPOB) TaxID=335543 RepID=A0LLV6_SYNFM|nr:hypothetical protein Sfum_2730 [Syntrophobacter fumaroxidans MPOB]